MAEFCKECSTHLFGKDHKDLAGIISKDEHEQGYISSVVICEGCGPIQVDHEGSCKSSDCIGEHRTHGPGYDLPTTDDDADNHTDVETVSDVETGDESVCPDCGISTDFGCGCDDYDDVGDEPPECYNCSHPLEDCICEDDDGGAA